MPGQDPKPPTILPQVRDVLSRSYPELSAAIVAVTDEVCEYHIQEVRKEIASASQLQDDPALDDVRDVLNAFAEALSGNGDAESLSLLGPAHAAARDGQSFTLEEVFGEYVLIRRSLHTRVVSHLGRPLGPVEAEALQSGIDAILASMVTSITGQREARLRLETTALSHFLTSLAHDLRNEINGVLLSMQLVEESGAQLQVGEIGDEPNRAAGLDSLLREVSSSRAAMEATIAAMTRLLEAEKLRNRIVVRPRDVDLRTLMHGIARSAGRIHARREVRHGKNIFDRVQIDCPENFTLRTDPELLSAVLVNLVGNALKYAPTGTIQFTAARVADGGCRIQVRDQGSGIAPDQLERLFQKFDHAGRQDGVGVGLGLFIARRASDLLKARISVDSEVGVGTCFTLELPQIDPRED